MQTASYVAQKVADSTPLQLGSNRSHSTSYCDTLKTPCKRFSKLMKSNKANRDSGEIAGGAFSQGGDVVQRMGAQAYELV
jgi:hypothetical protein